MEAQRGTEIESRKQHAKMKFTTEEDSLLSRFAMHFGITHWDLAPRLLPGRSVRQCRERWTKYLCPTNSFEPFSPDEDTLLKQLHLQYGAKWVKMSSFFKNRTDIALKNRWLVLMRQERKAEKPHSHSNTPSPKGSCHASPTNTWQYLDFEDDEIWDEF
jgi:hypothetical protein